jgi:hypothetical protein
MWQPSKFNQRRGGGRHHHGQQDGYGDLLYVFSGARFDGRRSLMMGVRDGEGTSRDEFPRIQPNHFTPKGTIKATLGFWRCNRVRWALVNPGDVVICFDIDGTSWSNYDHGLAVSGHDVTGPTRQRRDKRADILRRCGAGYTRCREGRRGGTQIHR